MEIKPKLAQVLKQQNHNVHVHGHCLGFITLSCSFSISCFRYFQMSSVHANNSKGSSQKKSKFIAPGKLAKRVYAQKAWTPDAKEMIDLLQKSTSRTKYLQVEEKEALHTSNIRRIDGLPAHTLIIHYGEDKFEEKNFTEESCFLDILRICSKYIDVYSVGVEVTYGDSMPLRNDEDLLTLLRKCEHIEFIELFLDKDYDAQPLPFKIPQGNPRCGSPIIPLVPEVRDVMILGEYKTNEIVIVCGDVINGTDEDSTVRFFIALSKNFETDPHMKSITNCRNNKEFQIPIEAVGHYIVAKFTPMTEEGVCGEPRYAVTEECVIDAKPSMVKKVRGKNKNMKISSLKSGEKLEINFYNNRGVGVNRNSWSRNLGKIVRDKNICPIRMKSWNDLTEFNKKHMWASVTEYFFSPNMELYREHTLEHMRDLWTSWRSTLSLNYVKPCESEAEVLKSVPPGGECL